MEALRFSRLVARSPLWPLFSATATHPKIPNARSFCSQVKIHTATDDKDKVQQKTRSQDHRDIGKQLELFLFHTYSPGSAFFLPHGTRVYNRLTNFLRDEYRQRGYEEVLTPLIFTNDLWKKSGHWENYSSDMYCVLPNGSFDHKLDNPTVTLHAPHEHISEEAGHCSTSDMFLLKPMNCPGHCLIFGSTTRSYRDLPMRLADFSPLHRNESSGTLSGLTRVRKFCQDDAHIFCAENQVGAEIQKCLEFMKSVYSKLGFTLRYRLSTRPEKFIGDLSVWNEAEGALKSVLENLGQPWVIAEGDGAFYGPKIDVLVTDSIKREHQCGTIQLDFQLPKRFDLQYSAEDGSLKTPVIIHRAIFGSVERLFALLLEHTHGRLPMWLSPRQCIVCPVSDSSLDYAKDVAAQLKKGGDYFVDVDTSQGTLKKKIRDAQLMQYNYILIIGEKEKNTACVNVRTREGDVIGEKTVEQLIELWKSQVSAFN